MSLLAQASEKVRTDFAAGAFNPNLFKDLSSLKEAGAHIFAALDRPSRQIRRATGSDSEIALGVVTGVMRHGHRSGLGGELSGDHPKGIAGKLLGGLKNLGLVDTTGEIGNLTALPITRGSGLRPKLFEHAATHMINNGATRITALALKHSEEENEFYKRMGGRTDGRSVGLMDNGSPVIRYAWEPDLLVPATNE